MPETSETLVEFLSEAFETGVPTIMCLGNETLSDDGVGIYIGQELRKLGYPDEKLILAHTVPESFIGKVPKNSQLLFIDAGEFGGEPAELAFVTDIREMGTALSTHRLPINMFIEQLKRRGVTTTYALLIQPASLEYGDVLSDIIKRRADEIAEAIMELLSSSSLSDPSSS